MEKVALHRRDLQTGEVWKCPADKALVFQTVDAAKEAARALNAKLDGSAQFLYTVKH